MGIAAGDAHVAATSLTGDTYFWGQNHHEQCARDPVEDDTNSFLASPTLAEGSVYTFGAGLSGQLGHAVCSNKAKGAPWLPAYVPLVAEEKTPGSAVPVLVVQVA